MIEQYKMLVSHYIKAKDHHQPHLMTAAFTEDAVLNMEVNTDAISFPSQVMGLNNITETLVKNFHDQYDNVYTFCISDSVIDVDNEVQCRWLVGMTEVDSGLFRVGFGDYRWQFTFDKNKGGQRVKALTIVIDRMVVLPAESASSVLSWFDSLPHPWLSSADLSTSLPALPILQEFLEFYPEKR